MTGKRLRVLTCNLNGIRAAQKKGFFDWVKQVDPDFICLQEIKADTSVMTAASFDLAGYHRYHASAEKKVTLALLFTPSINHNTYKSTLKIS